MMNRFPNGIDTQALQTLLEASGYDESRIRPVSGGKFNESWLVEKGTDRYVLRIAPADEVPQLFYEKLMMRSEPGIHRLVREHTDMPVPEIVHYDFSRTVVNRDYLFMTFEEGTPGAFDDAELGYYTRQLHDLKSEYFGYPERSAPTGKSWPAIFHRYVDLIFKDCQSCGILDEHEKSWFLSVFHYYRDVIKECRPCLLHLDLWSQNILTRQGKISAILDFDRGLYGDPELEFAVLDTYGYSTPEFFNGYGSDRPDSQDAQIRQRLYLVYEVIKYAFIRYARNGSRSTGRMHVDQCRDYLRPIAP